MRNNKTEKTIALTAKLYDAIPAIIAENIVANPNKATNADSFKRGGLSADEYKAYCDRIATVHSECYALAEIDDGAGVREKVAALVTEFMGELAHASADSYNILRACASVTKENGVFEAKSSAYAFRKAIERTIFRFVVQVSFADTASLGYFKAKRALENCEKILAENPGKIATNESFLKICEPGTPAHAECENRVKMLKASLEKATKSRDTKVAEFNNAKATIDAEMAKGEATIMGNIAYIQEQNPGQSGVTKSVTYVGNLMREKKAAMAKKTA